MLEMDGFEFERNKIGHPRMVAGPFTCVYHGRRHGSNRDIALRVWMTRVPDLAARYHILGDYLNRHPISSLVNFEFIAQGLHASSGEVRPVLIMDWIVGKSLFEAVRQWCRADDRVALSRTAELWESLIRELETHQVTHGDLDHSNIMVTDAGDLKLVDYDTLAVPPLFGRRNLEIGAEVYQHPARGHSTLEFAGLHNYSALVIATALRALAAEPVLWREFVEPSEGELHDSLLFRREDIVSPETSLLARRLRNSSSSHVRRLFAELCAASALPLEDVPTLTELAAR